MRKHTLNMYKLVNSSDLDFSYRLVQTNLSKMPGKDDLFAKQTQQVVRKVASLSKGPAVPIVKDGKLYVAIPADNTLENCSVDTAPLIVQVNLLPGVHHIPKASITPETKSIALRFLDFAISQQLERNAWLWKMGTENFFQKTPVKTDEDCNLDIYGGFKYKLLYQEDGYFYIVLDITYKYISRQSLAEHIEGISPHVAASRLRGRKALYQNGKNWYTVEVVGFADKIGDHEIEREGNRHNLYQYIARQAAGIPQDLRPAVSPEDTVLLYKYPGRQMEPHAGAASLARMIYQTDDKEVLAAHRYSVKQPAERFGKINHVVGKFFQGLTFNGAALAVCKNAETEQTRIFRVPRLLYNNERTLTVGGHPKDGGMALSDFGLERQQYLLDNGILNKMSFDAQYLIVPENYDQALVAALQRNIEQQLKNLAPAFTQFNVVRYRPDFKKPATYQAQYLDQLFSKQGIVSGCALFVLPDDMQVHGGYMSTFYDCVKGKFHRTLKVQCASGRKLKGFFQVHQTSDGLDYRVPEQAKGKFRAYLRNLVFEHLIVNRKWPYALADDLHYDVYVGIDVHSRYAGFTFFFKNGQQIFFASEKVPKKNSSQRAEKLKADLLFKIIYDKLKKYLPKYAANPNGIVVVRDGRSFGEEEKALAKVVAALAEDDLVDVQTLKTGIVDLHKQSTIPMRLVSQTNGHARLENPAIGACKMINAREGFLFTTGYPFRIPGTVHPMHYALRSGDVDFDLVMEDLFHQTMLAFSAPERGSRLPVTIKLIDTLLTPLSAMSDAEREDAVDEPEDGLTTIDN